MNKIIKVSFVFYIVFANFIYSQDIYCFGKVIDKFGYPAKNLKIKLVERATNSVVSITYSNSAGKYAFYGNYNSYELYRFDIYDNETYISSYFLNRNIDDNKQVNTIVLTK